MSISDLNQWIQLGISAFLFLSFCARLLKDSTKNTPIKLMLRSNWPLAVVVICAAGLSAFTWFLHKHSVQFAYSNIPTLKDIHDKAYINEIVDVDGRSFRHCTFQNVTLRWQGRSQFEFLDNNFTQPIRFVSDNPAVTGAWSLAGGLGAMPNSRLLNHDGSPATNIQPMSR